MVTTASPKPTKNKTKTPAGGTHNRPDYYSYNPGHWPRDIGEAYQRGTGPYTVHNAITILQEEPLELYNGWLVWQEMTEPEERRIAGIIQVILDLAAREAGFGQAYPDQMECKLKSGDTVKPDVSVLSSQSLDARVIRVGDEPHHKVLDGSPELVVEIRSPSNRRKKEREKRTGYFESGTLVVWDVEPFKHKIWVWEAGTPNVPHEYREGDVISCEAILPGWTRAVADFFARNLSAEQIVGQVAQEWRNESRAEGEVTAMRQLLVLQAGSRFPNAPTDLATRLDHYNVQQLTILATGLINSPTFEDWLATFPV